MHSARALAGTERKKRKRTRMASHPGRYHEILESFTRHIAEIGYHDVKWPVQYLSGKQQLERNIEREKQMAAQAAEAANERFN